MADGMQTPYDQGGGRGGYGYRLNNWERNFLDSLMVGLNAGMDPQMAYGLFQGTIDQAQARRQQNMATMQQGIAGLQELAAQYAASGAAPGAVSSLVGGMASDLPMMNGPKGQDRLGDLQSFVGGLYSGGMPTEVGVLSGLASPELRQAMALQPTTLAEEDRAALGQRVLQLYQGGVPFKDIRSAVEQDFVAAGYDPALMEVGMSEAERIYEELSGVQMEDLRGLGDYLREQQGMPGQWEIPGATGVNGPVEGQDIYEQWLGAGGREYEGDDFDVTGLLGWMASQRPEMLQDWMGHYPGPVPYDPNGGGQLQAGRDTFRPGQGNWGQDILESGSSLMNWITGLLE
jgi:hypothetical protein